MPQSSVPMPPNQPTAPPGPLTLGDLFSSTVATYKRGWKLFLPLACIPIAIYAVAFIVLGIVMVLAFIPLANTRVPDFGAALGPIIGVSALAIIGLIAISIFCYVFYGRMMLASLDYATGREVPTWATLAQRTQGLMGRLVAFAAICAGVGIAAYLVFAIVIGATVFGLSRNNSGAAAFIIFLAVAAFAVAAIWISVKITYTLVVMTEERLSAMDALKRSFALTKGAFWRTFGYSLVIGLVLGVITSIPQGMMNTGLQNASSGSGFGAMGLLGSLLVLVVSIAVVPVSYIWTSLMYLGRTRELANIAAGYPATGAGYGAYGAAGAPWQDQGQPFGQTPASTTRAATTRTPATPARPTPARPTRARTTRRRTPTAPPAPSPTRSPAPSPIRSASRIRSAARPAARPRVAPRTALRAPAAMTPPPAAHLTAAIPTSRVPKAPRRTSRAGSDPTTSSPPPAATTSVARRTDAATSKPRRVRRVGASSRSGPTRGVLPPRRIGCAIEAWRSSPNSTVPPWCAPPPSTSPPSSGCSPTIRPRRSTWPPRR